MSYNTKNYTEQGGDVTCIGGKLLIDGGCLTLNVGGKEMVIGPASNQSESEATTVAGLKEDFNDLLLKLKDAGLMFPDPVSE